MMTRNDFELIADRLKAMYPKQRIDEPTGDVHYRDGYNTAINQIAGACGASNSRFNIDRFKDACGVQGN